MFSCKNTQSSTDLLQFSAFLLKLFNAALWFPQQLEPVVNSAFSLLVATNTDKPEINPPAALNVL